MIKTALIGIGGFGRIHTDIICSLAQEGIVQCAAFAEKKPAAASGQYDRLTSIGAVHYADYQEMLGQHTDLDLVIIATPIPLHKPMAVDVMKRGFHVLLEKPPAVTVQDLDELIETRTSTGRLCAVQFQNTSGRAFRLCLEKLQDQTIGKIKRITGVGMWKRTDAYYERTPWAGKLTHYNQYVLDGTLNNALAHLLHNCLIAAGSGTPTEADPLTVQAELYRAHQIESEDTACLRIQTRNQVEVLLYTTLCHTQEDTPYILIEGTDGFMRWDYKNRLVIAGRDGQAEESFEFPPENLVRNMYLNVIEALGRRGTLYSPIEDCRSFVKCTNGAFESSLTTHPVPYSALIREPENGTMTTYIQGLKELFEHAVQNGKLFSELNEPWSVATKPFSMDGYKEFRLFR